MHALRVQIIVIQINTFFPKNVTQTRKELTDLLCLSYRRGETFVIIKVSVCYFTKQLFNVMFSILEERNVT